MKANYKRYAKVGGGGLTCPCCMGKAAKPIFKKIGRKHLARITDHLIADELEATVTDGTDGHWRDNLWFEHKPEPIDLLLSEAEQNINDMRYAAWAFNGKYANESRIWDDAHYKADAIKYGFDMRGASRFADYDHIDYDPSRWAHMQEQQYDSFRYDAQRVLTVGNYEVNRWNTDIYHVEKDYNFIGSIRLAHDMTWHVDYVPQRGEQTHYEFDYLDTSIEAATQMLILLHKLEVDNHELQ